jgi:hypothetical protein
MRFLWTLHVTIVHPFFKETLRKSVLKKHFVHGLALSHIITAGNLKDPFRVFVQRAGPRSLSGSENVWIVERPKVPKNAP